MADLPGSPGGAQLRVSMAMAQSPNAPTFFSSFASLSLSLFLLLRSLTLHSSVDGFGAVCLRGPRRIVCFLFLSLPCHGSVLSCSVGCFSNVNRFAESILCDQDAIPSSTNLVLRLRRPSRQRRSSLLLHVQVSDVTSNNLRCPMPADLPSHSAHIQARPIAPPMLQSVLIRKAVQWLALSPRIWHA